MTTSLLSASDLLKIEYLCEAYRRNAPDLSPSAICQFIGAIDQGPLRAQLLLELLTSSFEQSIDGGSNLAGISLTADYHRQIPELQDSNVFRAAFGVEYELRSQRGDRPAVVDFLDWLDADTPAHRAALYQTIHRLRPMIAEVDVDARTVVEISLDQRVIFGRAAKTEPAPVVILPESTHLRVITSSEKYVSRQQVLLYRPSSSCLHVENVGSKLPIVVDGTQRLMPGDVYEAEAISVVEFHNVAVRLRSET